MSGKTWQNCRWRTCNWLVKASCTLTRAYALTTEYCGRKVNHYIAWVKFIHITCQIKIQETSKPLSIMHISDLDKLFLDVDLSPTVWVRQYGNSIAITQGEFRVSAVSGMNLFLIISIGMKQLDIVILSSVAGVGGIPILPLAIIQ